jgi:hypothetical protein
MFSYFLEMARYISCYFIHSIIIYKCFQKFINAYAVSFVLPTHNHIAFILVKDLVKRTANCSKVMRLKQQSTTSSILFPVIPPPCRINHNSVPATRQSILSHRSHNIHHSGCLPAQPRPHLGSPRLRPPHFYHQRMYYFVDKAYEDYQRYSTDK